MYKFITYKKVKITNNTNVYYVSNQKSINHIIIDSHKVNELTLLNLKNLVYLEITYNIGASKVLLRNLTNLKTLLCHGYSGLIDNELVKLTSLTKLNCTRCINITSNSLKHLTNLVDLSCYYNDINYNFLANLTKLQILQLDTINIVNNISHITHLSNLQQINNEEGVNPNIVKLLPSLTYINCGKYNYTDNDILYPLKIKNLICGKNTKFTNKLFTELINIKELQLNYHVQFSYNLLILYNNLTTLRCGNIQIPDSIFKNLYKLEHLNCDGNNLISDNGLQYLINLTTLKCGKNNKFTDKSISILKKIQELDLGYNTLISDNGIRNLQNIIKINISYNRNISVSLFELPNLKYVEWIHSFRTFQQSEEFMRVINSLNSNVTKSISYDDI
jgi:hypothetical protein